MTDDDITAEMNAAVRDVFARHGQMASDPVIVVEVIEGDGKPVLWVGSGDLPLWSALGRLRYAQAVMEAAAVDRDD
jgi:hypothetical protein